MKRSEINRVIDEAREFWGGLGFLLPPYAAWDLEAWRACREDCTEIFDLGIGWDVTSFGEEDFLKCGLLLYTLRNGKLGSAEYPKPYAEKIMMVREGQVTPRHFHWHKREDIINRGGGNLVIELFRADPSANKVCGGPFSISVNGIRRQMNSGDKLILPPGESVALEPIHAHKFYGEPGSGPSMIGEVSMVNDDVNDNCFVDGAVRFVPVIEDEPPRYLLACEYRQFLKG